MEQKQGAAKQSKGSPRILEHLKSLTCNDGDKQVTLKCTIKGIIFFN